MVLDIIDLYHMDTENTERFLKIYFYAPQKNVRYTGLGMIWRWVNNGKFLIFGWSIHLIFLARL